MESLSDAEIIERMQSEEYGQSHLFPEGQSDSERSEVVAQLRYFDQNYPGGLISYIQRSRTLLASSAAGENPFEGFVPTVPEGESIDPDRDLDNFLALESMGIPEMGKLGFVLVAGGLGERLGYSSIKVGLPVELITSNCFLELYIQSILAIQERTGVKLPLAIMTSEDTHDRTIALLEENQYFGMQQDQITLMRQEKVPALIDNEARFAVENGKLIGKPHGHGDVHILLFKQGLAQKWQAEGKEWVLFLQDTNPLVFKALASFLGVSKKYDFAMNFMTVPRKPKESMGGIMTLKRGEESRTMNVEYNLIDPLIKESGMHANGDVSNAELGLGGDPGNSPFPGNTNTLLYKLSDYIQALVASEGHMPEFVNPKYADATKTNFKAPTRLECMMQDFSKMFGAGSKVGFASYVRWISFTAVKNSLAEAAVKSSQGLDTWCAGSCESDYYFANGKLLQLTGAQIEPPQTEEVFSGIKYQFPAKIVLMPSFAVSFTEIKDKVRGQWSISSKSALILDGSGTSVNGLKLNGHIAIGESKENVVKEDGEFPVFIPVEPGDAEYLQIRGYKLAHN